MIGFSFPSEDVLFASRGRIPLTVIGSILLLIGLLMLYGAYALATSDGQLAGKVVGGIAATVMASAFVVGGSLLLNGPDQTTIDRQRQTVVQQFGSTIAIRRREFPLANFGSVRVARARLKGHTSSVPSYRVELVGINGENLIVQSVRKPEEAQGLARQVSAFLDFPLSPQVD